MRAASELEQLLKWQTLYLFLLYLITSSLIFIIILKTSNKISNDSGKVVLDSHNQANWLHAYHHSSLGGVTWCWGWSSSKQLQSHAANLCATGTFPGGRPGGLGHQLWGQGRPSAGKPGLRFFFPAKASDTGVIRTGGCEFAKSELLHTCTANLSEIFIFSILYC